MYYKAVKIVGNMEICNEKLIEAVRSHECIYLKKHKEYKNKAMKDAAWDAIAVVMGTSAYNCRTRWRSLCDRNRKEMSESIGASGSGSSTRKPWKLKDTMSFLNDSMDAEKTVTNVQRKDNEEEASPQRQTCKRRKMDELFEDVLLKMKNKYETTQHESKEDERFFDLLREKFSRLSAEDKDEIQVEILCLVSDKISKNNDLQI